MHTFGELIYYFIISQRRLYSIQLSHNNNDDNNKLIASRRRSDFPKNKMGNAIALPPAGQVSDEKRKVANLMNILENKRLEFMANVKLTRGEGSENNKEIQGGRSCSRISQLRIMTDKGVARDIEGAIEDFITAAQGGDQAKSAAVEGAKGLLSAGLKSIFGCSSGTGMEKTGFVILFLNFSFVRIDYYVYAYNASAESWGHTENECGSCYVADIAILNPNKDVLPHEIDYLLGQALKAPPPQGDDDENYDQKQAEYLAVLQMKMQLVQSAILTRLLSNEDIEMKDLKEITTELLESQKAISEAFNSLADYTKPSAEE
jgi:hypothetical protein